MAVIVAAMLRRIDTLLRQQGEPPRSDPAGFYEGSRLIERLCRFLTGGSHKLWIIDQESLDRSFGTLVY